MHVAYLSHHLNHQKFDNRVAFTPGQHLDYRFYESGTEVVTLSMGRGINPLGLIRDYRKLVTYIRQNQIDIVHTHNTLAGLVGRLAAKRVGVPVIIHMFHTFAANPSANPLRQKLFLQIDRFWGAFTTYFIAGSNFIRLKAVRRHITPPEKIQVIHYAVDVQTFLEVSVSPNQLLERRKALNIQTNKQIIGFVGRLEEQKAPDVFIKALAQVVQARQDVHAIVVGDGHLRTSIEALSRQLKIENNVSFLGWRNDIPELFSVMDVFCLPSRWEAFGIVFAEASVMGVPVVATRVEGIPEVVLDGGSGILVDKDSPVQIAEALLEILSAPDLGKEMGRRGKEHVLKHFTIESMVDSHARLYEELLTKINPSR